jgi:hypothetical protein
MEKGNTSLILNPFMEGLRDGGADVEIFHTAKLNIKPCQGDIRCWVKTPGACFQDDDMRTLLPKLSDAELWVFATPIYMDGMAGPLKTLMDRMQPLAEPFMEVFDNHNYHLMRKTVPDGKIVLVSNCGLWEADNFEPLLALVKAFSRNVRRDFAGALLRPHGPAMRMVPADALGPVFQSARSAGRELARSGKMPQELLDAVSREILPRDEYIAMINKGFKGILKARGLL